MQQVYGLKAPWLCCYTTFEHLDSHYYIYFYKLNFMRIFYVLSYNIYYSV